MALTLLNGAAALPPDEATPAPVLMPRPAEIRVDSGQLVVLPEFTFAVDGADDARLAPAVERLAQQWSARTGKKLTARAAAPAGATILLQCERAAAARPQLGEDESYTLTITGTQARLQAATTTGALRGIATLTQLLEVDGDANTLPGLTVVDAPRFPWRGLMIDVVRHWQPAEVIRRNLDAMALVKLNVLHLHLTDDQGFRIESRTHPELHTQASDGHFFTQAEMRELIAYAAARGIRVVPEFDVPGHATAWLVSHPELGSAPGPYAPCRRWGVERPVLDPTNEALYPLLDDFFGEMAALFPDDYLHIGGDENDGVQWNANTHIQEFIRTRGLKDNAGLHAWFNSRLAAILHQHGKHLVGWDEILHPDLPPQSVVHSWRGPAGLAAAARAGHPVILSNGYYIDLNYPAADHYRNDPLPADTPLTPAEQKLVLGGEATMWSEWVTPDNIDTRIWPRTAAIAERLWSPRTVADVAEMYRRLPVIDERLQEAGTQQGAWPKLAQFDTRTADDLRAFAQLVEPVKRYARGRLQRDVTQQTPLNDLADWAQPESVRARELATYIEQWLLEPEGLDAVGAMSIAQMLDSWRRLGERVAEVPVNDTPVQQGRKQKARELTAVARSALEALRALAGNATLTPEQRTAAQQALTAAAKPNASAVEFPTLPALRLLVGAAMIDPAERAKIAPDKRRERFGEAVSRSNP